MLQKESQNCQIMIDLRSEKCFRLWKDQGLRICNYFDRMVYSFFTIMSLKSSSNHDIAISAQPFLLSPVKRNIDRFFD